MNLILLFPGDFLPDDPGRVTLHDRRLTHIQQVHRASTGDFLNVGLINGNMGHGRIIALSSESVTLEVELTQAPPAPLPLTLLLALPRPKMLKRVLQSVTSLGVKRLIIINSYRVEKSYWQTPILTPDGIQEQLVLGLEQARDTQLPEVQLVKRFKPFVEDELPRLVHGQRALVAHPGDYPACPRQMESPLWLAIGPEGGFIPYEIDKLVACGFEPVQLGERILRVETAVPALIGRLF